MSADYKSDSSNGTKSREPELLDSFIRIRTFHALTIIVAGMLALLSFVWTEFEDLEDKVGELAEDVYKAEGDRLGSEYADEIIKEQ